MQSKFDSLESLKQANSELKKQLSEKQAEINKHVKNIKKLEGENENLRNSLWSFEQENSRQYHMLKINGLVENYPQKDGIGHELRNNIKANDDNRQNINF